MCFQDVTKIIEDVVELFEKLIVRRPLGVVLENSIEHQLRKISTINFTIPIVSKFVNHIHISIHVHVLRTLTLIGWGFWIMLECGEGAASAHTYVVHPKTLWKKHFFDFLKGHIFGFSRHFFKYFFVYVKVLMNEIQTVLVWPLLLFTSFRIILFRSTKTSLVKVQSA